MKLRTAEIELHDSGIIHVQILRDAKQDLPEAKENLGGAVATGAGLRRPLAIDIRYCKPLTPEARRYYSGQVLIDSFTAMAIILDSSPFGKMMGNVYLQIAKPGIPTRLFTDDKEAFKWLTGFVDGP